VNELDKARYEYQSIEVPDELEFFVRTAINRRDNRVRISRIVKTSIAAVAALAVAFVGTVNLSPVAASAMSDIPVINNLVRVVTLGQFQYQDDRHAAEIKVPAVEGLQDSTLEQALNQKYLDESTRLYQEFLDDLGQKELSPRVLALQANYQVKTQTPDLLVVERVKLEVGASGTESVAYDNIDLKNQLVITLPGLFKDDSYVEVISDYILAQMKRLTNKQEGILYWFEDSEFIKGFKKIDPEQSFYINSESKLRVVFDECEVAPCAMGIVEFAIPTEAIQGVLVSNTYIR
jgi:hypothetical protein